MITDEELRAVADLERMYYRIIRPKTSRVEPGHLGHPDFTYVDSGIYRDVFRYRSGEFVVKLPNSEMSERQNRYEVENCESLAWQDRPGLNRVPLAMMVNNAVVMEFVNGDNPADVVARELGYLDFDHIRRCADEAESKHEPESYAAYAAYDEIMQPLWDNLNSWLEEVGDLYELEDVHEGNVIVEPDGTLCVIDVAF